MFEDFIIPDKCNLIIDGQFGSTGKGLIASAIAAHCHVDIAVGRLSPNAGHTFYYNSRKYITKLLPVAGIMQPKSTIYLCAGSVIDPDLLEREIKEFDIDPDRIVIHPRAAVITPEDKEREQSPDGIVKIASTQSGSGEARASKIMRKNPLVQGISSLQRYIHTHFDLYDLLQEKHGLNVLIETGQGFDLGLNFGYNYPYCTSIDVIPSAVLSDLGCHPHDLGNVMMAIRTYPIRVGNVSDSEGREIGYSGPVYPDSQELTWEELEQKPERTTVTKRIRRVFTFSEQEYLRSLRYIRPTHIFLNFINYLGPRSVLDVFHKLNIQRPTHVGYGPRIDQVCPWDDDILFNAVYKGDHYVG